jgi:16S rRNA G966 N2-methylase RsmD
LVQDGLRSDLRATVVFADDSAVMINTDAPVGRITGLPYITNAFVVIATAQRRRSIEQSVAELARSVDRWDRSDRVPPGKPFRIMYSDEGKLAGVKGRGRSDLEAAVARFVRGRLDPRGGSGNEFWVITRRDHQQALLARRITKRKSAEAAKGALRPDLAALLIKAARLGTSDVLLDPFGGSGAVVAAALRGAVKQAIYSDLHQPRKDIDRTLERSSKVLLLREDARRLPSIGDHSVDVIVTDPPWNEYEQLDGDYGDFIVEVLASFRRVLKDKGRLVMLTSRNSATALGDRWPEHGFDLRRTIDILVNGHPASVLIGGVARRSVGAKSS